MHVGRDFVAEEFLHFEHGELRLQLGGVDVALALVALDVVAFFRFRQRGLRAPEGDLARGQFFLQFRAVQFDEFLLVFDVLFGDGVALFNDVQNLDALPAFDLGFDLLAFQRLDVAPFEYFNVQGATPDFEGRVMDIRHTASEPDRSPQHRGYDSANRRFQRKTLSHE